MINKIMMLVVICLVACLSMGCSTSGSGQLNASAIPSSDKIVVFRPNTEPGAVEYMPEVTESLRRTGFVVVSEGTAPYEVSVIFAGGGWGLTCAIVMYHRGVPIVSGKGVNPGWGVWLARDSAYRGVFEGALKQFEERLGTR
jgi:hypothetical protein